MFSAAQNITALYPQNQFYLSLYATMESDGFERSTNGASLVDSNEALLIDHINSHRHLWNTRET